jgi:hypothetical protein
VVGLLVSPGAVGEIAADIAPIQPPTDRHDRRKEDAAQASA